MFGGFLKGVLAGVAVAAASLVVLTVLTEAPPSADPPDLGARAGAPKAPVTPPAPAVTDAEPPAPEAAAAPTVTGPAPVLPATPAAEAPPASSAAPAAPPAAVSVDVPAAPDAPLAPPASAEAAAPAAEDGPAPQSAPLRPELPGDEPALKLVEAAPSSEKNPLAPTVAAPTPPEPQGEASPAIAEDSSPVPVAPPALAALPEAPLAEVAPEAAADPVPAAPDPQAQPQTPVDAEPAEIPAAAPDEPAEAPPAEGTTAQGDPTGPTPGLGDGVEGVTVDRLPQIGDPPPAPDPAATAEADAVLETGELPPLQRDARAFENPDQKPLFAVILIDSGEAALDRATLAEIPFPVSFALDPLDPATPGRAKLYRDAGQEVLMLATGLPEGAGASDVEVALSAMGDAMPQAVAVLDTVEGAFQDDRPLATGVIPVIASQGRGVVTWDRGLNAADQVARRDGVPAAVIFRSLDGEGEAAPIIRRYLDRAAFKAAQEGRVVVAGTTRPETVAALLEWAVEGRSASVAFAPVTAVLSLP